jgi:hypothetical protein
MPVITPAIKFFTFEPIGSFALGDKDIHFHEAPGGISYAVTHLNPVNARRTQDGSLITQTIRYNKKVIDLSLTFFDVTIKTYFQALRESGLRITLSIWVENPTTFVEETEFNGIVQMLSMDEDTDQSSNVRTLTMNLSEV